MSEINNGAKAKEVSKVSMIVAGIWIGALSILKGFSPLLGFEFGLEIKEIVFSGVAIAAVFTPVYFSIFMDKIKDVKLSGEEKITYTAYGRGDK